MTYEFVEQACSQNIGCLTTVVDARDGAKIILEDVLWQRLNTMRNRMSKLLSRERGDTYVRAIHQAYNDLSPARQARVLMSGEFYDCYSRLGREERLSDSCARADPSIAYHYGVILDLLLRERAIQCLAENMPSKYLAHTRVREVWSPVGDVAVRRDRQGTWSIWTPPMLGDVIAVDFDSPIAISHEPRSGVLSQQQLDFTENEKDVVVEKLGEALRIIDELQPVYGLLIRNYVRRVIVRKSVDAEYAKNSQSNGLGLFVSEHVHWQPGSIRLLNLHLQECSPVLCVEKLLHESTHNFLAAWEMANGPFVHNDESYRPVSPWSGNPIPNSSLVHATFIYYMCHRLFIDFLGSNLGKIEGRSEQIGAKLGLFAAGFLIPQSIFAQLLIFTEQTSQVQALLEGLQMKIKGQYRYVH